MATLLPSGLMAVLLAVAGAVLLVDAARRRTRLISKVYGVGACPNRKSALVVNNWNIAMDANGGDYVMLDFNMTKRMTRITKILVPITKCSGGFSPSLCEYYSTWSWHAGLCELVRHKHFLWTPAVQSTVPPFQCPISEGRYVCHNGTLDMAMLGSLLMGIPRGMENFIWRAEAQLFDEDSALNACVFYIFQVRRVGIRE